MQEAEDEGRNTCYKLLDPYSWVSGPNRAEALQLDGTVYQGWL